MTGYGESIEALASNNAFLEVRLAVLRPKPAVGPTIQSVREVVRR